MANVLITGAAGGVGKAASAELLRRGHAVTGFDRVASPPGVTSVVGDICDRDAVIAASEGMDAVIHLAATPDEADFIEALIEPNVRGLYHVCDAARQHGVSRLILTSSVQVVWGHEWDHVITVDDGPRVLNHYALTKLWAEDIGEMYARCYGHSVIAARLGWLPRSPAHHEELQASPTGRDVFLSHDDAGRFFASCVEAPMADHRFEILFATSIPKDEARVDLEPAKRVTGYEPQDTWPEGISFD
jgi:nucleoside-diphosphate-sugar epimerase